MGSSKGWASHGRERKLFIPEAMQTSKEAQRREGGAEELTTPVGRSQGGVNSARENQYAAGRCEGGGGFV